MTTFITNNAVDLPELGSAPAAPDVGRRKLFFGDDGYLYAVGSDGTVVRLQPTSSELDLLFDIQSALTAAPTKGALTIQQDRTLNFEGHPISWEAVKSFNGAYKGTEKVIWVPSKGKFYSLSNSGLGIAESPDGYVWSNPPTTPTLSGLYTDIIFVEELEKFFLLSRLAPARVYHSVDGYDWTAISGLPENTWNRFAWSPTLNRLVAVASSGSGNRAMYSSDGLTWEIGVIPDANWNSVIWAPGLNRFLAVSSTEFGAHLGYSTDGITWETVTGAFSSHVLKAIAWSPTLSRAAVLGSGGAGFTQTGEDINLGALSSRPPWNAVEWIPSEGVFVAIAGASSTAFPAGLVGYSYDGQFWKMQDLPVAGQWNNLAFSPELGVIVSGNGISNRGYPFMVGKIR
jgi:hypothetical protein